LFEIIMRKLFTALACAAAHVPQFVHAESAFPGPADASASVPVVTVPPAFAEYRRYDNSDAVEWIRLNRALAPGRGESAAPSRSISQGRAAARDRADHFDHASHDGHTDSIGRTDRAHRTNHTDCTDRTDRTNHTNHTEHTDRTDRTDRTGHQEHAQ
jgi:hypothetical protein